MLAPTQQLTAPVWPITADADDLLAVVHTQARTIANQEALIHAYQGVLSAAQAAAAPATGTGNSTGTTTLTVTAPTGVIGVNNIVAGTGVAPGTTILGQTSGPTGGAGNYTTSQPSSCTNAALTFTPATIGTGTGTGTSLVMSGVVGMIRVGDNVSGIGIPTGTTIVAQQLGTPGGSGTYTTSQATTATAAALTFTSGVASSPWPVPEDADTLNLLVQNQTAVIKNQTALIQQYQDVLNTSQTAAPPTGP